jgi:hypothetical protein
VGWAGGPLSEPSDSGTPTTTTRNANLPRMSNHKTTTTVEFTPSERSYIRQELDRFFSTFPTVEEGFQLKTRKTGPLAGQPKLPPAGKSLVERGLMRLDTSRHPPRLFFTRQGTSALRCMMANPRLADPEKFAHIRRELGLEPGSTVQMAG